MHVDYRNIWMDEQGWKVYDTVRWEPVWDAGSGFGPGGAREGNGHVQHQPCLLGQEISIRLCLRSPPALQFPQHNHQGNFCNPIHALLSCIYSNQTFQGQISTQIQESSN